MNKLLDKLSGLITNPETGDVSHSKLWANIAHLAMTIKFMQLETPPLDYWWAYGVLVGGYALIRRGIAGYQQVKEDEND